MALSFLFEEIRLCRNCHSKQTVERILMSDTHHLVKTILIPQVAELLMKNKGLSEDEALKTIYQSPVAKLLEDDSMGLYGQSALYLYGLIEKSLPGN